MTKTEQQEAERHRVKMAKRKAVQDEEVAGKQIEKGLLIVHTGTGKGKSTAAFGLALRMPGRGKRIGVVQSIQGPWHSAGRDALEGFGDQVCGPSVGGGPEFKVMPTSRGRVTHIYTGAGGNQVSAIRTHGDLVHVYALQTRGHPRCT